MRRREPGPERGQAADCHVCDGVTTDVDANGVADVLRYVDCGAGNDSTGIGAPVTLWGKGVAGEVPADEVAAAAGTIAYELFCAVAPRVPVVLDLPAEGGL